MRVTRATQCATHNANSAFTVNENNILRCSLREAARRPRATTVSGRRRGRARASQAPSVRGGRSACVASEGARGCRAHSRGMQPRSSIDAHACRRVPRALRCVLACPTGCATPWPAAAAAGRRARNAPRSRLARAAPKNLNPAERAGSLGAVAATHLRPRLDGTTTPSRRRWRAGSVQRPRSRRKRKEWCHVSTCGRKSRRAVQRQRAGERMTWQ
jgi:hypothetical protein